MKRIRPMQDPTTGLADYLHQDIGESTWERFRYHDNGNAYQELRNALVSLQHGLCGYCEINLLKDDSQIEHVIPQNDSAGIAADVLDTSNLIACCKGGTARNHYAPDTVNPDTERYLQPTSDNVSCGQAKGNRTDPCFIDPRILPAVPSLLRVRDDGTIHADKDACAVAGVSVCSVKQTIEILGLNVRRIRRARAQRWDDLNSNWASYFDDPEVIEQVAREELLPEDGGVLSKFFTTNRSYFAPLSERILAEQPQAWI